MHSSITSFLAKAASATSLSNPKVDETLTSSSMQVPPSAASQSNLLTTPGSRLSSLSLTSFKSPTSLLQEIRDTLQLFDAAGSNPQKLVKSIEKLLRVLKRHPPHPDLPLKHQIARKLFACLQPQYPVTLHQLTLQAFAAIFERVGSARLMADIPMYLPSLLSFIAVASVPNKLLTIGLLEDHFLPLGTALCGCLTGFISLILPMMEFSPISSANHSLLTQTNMTSSLPPPTPGLTPKLTDFLERLRSVTGHEPFLIAVWQAAALGPSLRLPCLQYLRTHLLTDGAGSPSTIGLKALYYSLQDQRPIVFKEALSLLITYCPLHDIMIGSEWLPMMIAVFNLLLQNDEKIKIDIIAWLMGTYHVQINDSDETSYFAKHTEHLFIQAILELLKQTGSSISTSPVKPSIYAALQLIKIFLEADPIFSTALFPRITPQLLAAIFSISTMRTPPNTEHTHLIAALTKRHINLWSEIQDILVSLTQIDTPESRVISFLQHCLSLYNLYPIELLSPADFSPELMLTLISVLKNYLKKSCHPELLRNGVMFLSCCISPAIWSDLQQLALLYPVILPLQELFNLLSRAEYLATGPVFLQSLTIIFDGLAGFVELLSPAFAAHSPIRPSLTPTTPVASPLPPAEGPSTPRNYPLDDYHAFITFSHHFLRTYIQAQHPEPIRTAATQTLARLSNVARFIALQPDATILSIVATCWGLIQSTEAPIHEQVVEILASLCPQEAPAITAFITTQLLSGRVHDRVLTIRRFATFWKVSFSCPPLRKSIQSSALAALDCLRDHNAFVQNDASQWAVAAMRFSFHELLEPLLVEIFVVASRSFQNQYQSHLDIDRVRSTLHLIEQLSGTDPYLFLTQTLALTPPDWLLELNAKQLLLLPPLADPKSRPRAGAPLTPQSLMELASASYSPPLLWFLNNVGQSYAHLLVFICLRFLSNRFSPALVADQPELVEKNNLLQVAAANFLTFFFSSFANPLLALEKVALLKTLVEQSRWVILDLLETSLECPSLHCALLLTLRSCFAIGMSALPEEPTQNPLVHVALFTTKTISFPLLHLSQFESKLLVMVRKALQFTYASESIFPQWIAFLSYSHAELTQLAPSIMLWITELLSGESELFQILHSCLVLYFDFYFLALSTDSPKIISLSSSAPAQSSPRASAREAHPLSSSCLLQLVPELISSLTQHINSTQVSRKSKWDISHCSQVLAPLLQAFPSQSLFAILQNSATLPRMVFLILEDSLSLPKLFQILLSSLIQNHSRKSTTNLDLLVSDANIHFFCNHFLSCAAVLSAQTWDVTKSILRTGNAHANDPQVLTGLLQILWTFVRRVPPQVQSLDADPDEPVQIYRKELNEILLSLVSNLVKYLQSFAQHLKTQREILQIESGSADDDASEFNVATFENILQLISQLEKSLGFLCYSIPVDLKDQSSLLQTVSSVLSSIFVFSKRGIFPKPDLKLGLRSAILRYFISLIQYPVLCRACRRQILDLLNSDVFFPLPQELYQDCQRLISHILRKDDAIFLALVRSLPTSATLQAGNNDEESHRSQGRAFKRLAFSLLSGSTGQFEKHLPLLLETFGDCFNICYSSPYLLAPLFLCFRVLIVRFDPSQIRAIWSLLFPELVRILTTINSPTPLPFPLDSVSLLAATKLIQMTTYLGIEEFCVHHWSFFQTHQLLSSDKYSPFFHQLRADDYFSTDELALEHHQREQNNNFLASLHFGDPDYFSPIPALEKLQSEFLTPGLLQWISMGAQPSSSKTVYEQLLEREFIVHEEIISTLQQN